MLKKIILSLVSICFYSQINAQITDYIPSVLADRIVIEDNFIYFTGYSYDADFVILIKRVDLIEGLPSEIVVADFASGPSDLPSGLAKNGDYIYCSSYYFEWTDPNPALIS